MSDGDDESVASEEGTTNQPRITRSGRVSHFPKRYDDYIALLCENKVVDEGERIMALAASSDPDILYLNEALAVDDRAEFVRAMDKEVKAHMENKNWEIILRKDIPPEKYYQQYGI
jgi:hypothetical protein